MCRCRNIQDAFVWLGAILVHVAFWSVIAYGAVRFWPVGMLLCGLYTAGLFAVAGYVDGREFPSEISFSRTWDDESNQYEPLTRLNHQEEPEPQTMRQTSSSSSSSKQLLVNVLYFLAMVGVGATGFFLPVNVLSCSPDNDIPPAPRKKLPEWKTDPTTLPTPAVQSWALVNHGNSIKSYAYIPKYSVTLFSGRSQQGKDCLMETGGNHDRPHTNMSWQTPTSFVDVSYESACFLANANQDLVCWVDEHYVAVNRYMDTTIRTMDLLANADLLWYKGFAQGQLGYQIVSYNTTSQEKTSYSTLVQPPDDPDNNDDNDHKNNHECTYEQEQRRMAWGTLVTVGLPVTLTSIVLWWFILEHVDSMGWTAVGGMEIVFVCLHVAIAPSDSDWDGQWHTWHVCVGVVVVTVATVGAWHPRTQNTQRQRAWSGWITSGALLYWMGLLGLLVAGPHGDSVGDWITLNLVGLLPLLGLGMLHASMILSLLGGSIVVLDAWRLSEYFSSQNTNADDVQFWINFIIYMIAGSLVVAIGYVLNKYQAPFQTFVLEKCGYGERDTGSHAEDDDPDQQQNVALLTLDHESVPSLHDEEEVVVVAP